MDLLREYGEHGGVPTVAQRRSERLLALASEVDEGAGHAQRVGALSATVAAAMGWTPAAVARIRRAAPLHDVGKVEVPRSILDKPGRLTPDERRIVEGHTEAGGRMCTARGDATLELAAVIARFHHERWDGAGYPQGLGGTAIPMAARIVAVADVYDALVSERSYKRAWSALRARQYVLAGAGRAFDPEVVRVFLALPPATLRPGTSS